MMADQPVYSTRGGKITPTKSNTSDSYQQTAGPCKMRLENKGRGGKSVTLLFNLPFSEPEATALMKDLQGRLGIGATLKNSAIELRGDVRDKVDAYFKAKGLKLVRAGG